MLPAYVKIHDQIKKDIDEKSELERDVDSIRRLLEK